PPGWTLHSPEHCIACIENFDSHASKLAVTQNSLRLRESFRLVRVGSVAVIAIGLDRVCRDPSAGFGHTVDEVALGGDDVVVALGAREVEDELLRLIETIELAFDGGEGAEKGLAEIGQDGGAARGDAVLDEKH